MEKCLFVFGTRPEAIKMAPLVEELNKGGEVKVCVTAQHRQMLDQVLKTFRIVPDFDLNVMQAGQELSDLTSRLITEISKVLKSYRPNVIFVQGDTTTCLAGSLAAFYEKIPVAHVEAGLRSFNLQAPWPEEMNRRMATTLSRWHFAPTERAKRNLLEEKVPEDRICVTGNTVIDALQWAVSRPLSFDNGRLRKLFNSRTLPLSRSRLILVTAHRRENFGRPLKNICSALKAVADAFGDVQMVYPVHLNPNVQSAARKILAAHPRIHLLPPLNYLDFSRLMEKSHLVVTDSGGLQEEAPSLGKPVLVLREVTERPEAVRAKTAKVIGTEKNRIIREVSKLLEDTRLYRQMASARNPYGDGRAAQRICQALGYFFGYARRPKDFLPR